MNNNNNNCYRSICTNLDLKLQLQQQYRCRLMDITRSKMNCTNINNMDSSKSIIMMNNNNQNYDDKLSVVSIDNDYSDDGSSNIYLCKNFYRKNSSILLASTMQSKNNNKNVDNSVKNSDEIISNDHNNNNYVKLTKFKSISFDVNNNHHPHLCWWLQLWPEKLITWTFIMNSITTNIASIFRKKSFNFILLLTLSYIIDVTNCHYVNNNQQHHLNHHHHHKHQMRSLQPLSLPLISTSSIPTNQNSPPSSLIKISSSASSTKTLKKDDEMRDAPIFSSEIKNQTIAIGRDVVFECLVDHLGSYKLAWLKIDSLEDGGNGANYASEPELISIQTQIMSKDSRFRVSHVNMKQWFLHIKQVKSFDKGWYMCQINTEPLISQAAFLDILIAPSIDYNATSSDVSVDERHRLSIRCRAVGHPPPTVVWRREDNKDINLGLYGGKRYSAKKVEGEFLNITQVTRDDMGAYLCIASNSVPPSVSKRIIVHVNFRPKIKVSNQLVGSTIGSDVQLECRCEASPRPTTSWIRYDGQVLLTTPTSSSSSSSSSSGSGSIAIPPSKYSVREEHDSYRTKMKLRIFNLDEKDFGSYKCVAKNSLGEKEGLVRLYEIAPPSTPYLLSSWPTYIYTYQGKQQNNLNNNMMGDKNNADDYNDYHHQQQQQQASSASSSSSSLSSWPSLSLSKRTGHHFYRAEHQNIIILMLFLFGSLLIPSLLLL